LTTATTLIDVLIPAYNAEGTVEEAIASIQAQTIEAIRIVVVDDGSTDATPEILARIAAADPRVVVIRRDNGGIVDALNQGLGACAAEIIARHDADDIAFPNRFAVQLDYLRANPDCVAVGCNAWHIDGAGKRLGKRSIFGGDVKPDAFWAPSREPYIMHPFLMMRRSAAEAVGGYRYAFHSEDTDFFWRLMDVGRLHNLTDIYGEYRIHNQSISSASALNGRISAVNSQLAALSARRRMQGSPDIAFEKETLAAYHEADTMEAIVELAAKPLSPEEREYLEVAVAAKLMSLSAYRPYALTVEDYGFIRNAISRYGRTVSPANRRDLARWQAGLVVKLAKSRSMKAAMALSTPPIVVRAIAQAAKAELRKLAGKDLNASQ